MASQFSNHFGRVASAYAASRPGYPAALFDWLVQQCAGHERVWDCACGSGQASLALGEHFHRIDATDASAEQISQAKPHPNVAYSVAPAGASGLEPHSVDLVTVAQALHWFDLESFYAEVRRVAKPGAIFAAWTYGLQHVEDSEVDAIVQHFYRDTVGPCWPPERALVEAGYRGLPFPFERIETPPFEMVAAWTLDELCGYFSSWSAVGRYVATTGEDPVQPLRAQIERLWSDGGAKRVVWPLTVLAGRI